MGGGASFNSVNSELECLASVQRRTEGACAFSVANKEEKVCKFTNIEECDSIGGVFWENTLCSNEDEIDSICEKQNYTSCVEGFDEIYWFDSCDNRENIYEGSSRRDKEISWNNGLVKEKDESCVMGTASYPVRNQGSCGNCNRLLSSICGEKIEGEQELDDEEQDVVCLDLGCYDEEGDRIREHGESWCAYQGQIGLPGEDGEALDLIGGILSSGLGFDLIGGERSVDTPGSLHFRKSCLNGEISTNSCDNYRNYVCVEQQTEKDGGGTFSQASCRVNRWQECLDYNPSTNEGQLIGMLGGEMAGKILELRLRLTCGKDPDCFVKTVNVDKDFQFSYCAPRYAPGFDLENGLEVAQTLCGAASQKCTAVYVKKISGWTCEANCDCEKPEFAQKMNDFCTSLGDCGFSVNYVGDRPGGKGYSIYEEKKGTAGFLTSGLLENFGGIDSLISSIGVVEGDAEPIEGEYIHSDLLAPDDSERNKIDDLFSQLTGFNGGEMLGGMEEIDGESLIDDSRRGILGVSGIVGGLGATASAVSYSAEFIVSRTLPVLYEAGGGLEIAGVSSASISGFGNVAMGAAAGSAITSYALDALGISRGLNSELATGIEVLGGAGGGVYGSSLGAGAAAESTLAAAEVASATAEAGIVAADVGSGISQGIFAAAEIEAAQAGAASSLAESAALTTKASSLTSTATSLSTVAIVIAVVVIIIIAILKIAGIGDVDKRPLKFECKPWVRPRGGSDELCGSCGMDKMSDGSENFPCSKYSCEALGQDCLFVPGSEIPEKGGICEYSPNNDVSAPVIVSLREDILTDGFEYTNVNLNPGGEFTVRKEGKSGDDVCLDQFERVEYGFKMDEFSVCKISGNRETPFESMIEILRETGGRNFRHAFSSTQIGTFGIEGFEVEEKNDVKLYVVCEDSRENNNFENPYVINLCVVPRDLTAPSVTVGGGSVLPFDSTEYEFVVGINEPSECRYDFNDVDFTDMTNELQCSSEFDRNDFGVFGCLGNIPSDDSSVEIFIRCRDHPEWVGTDREGERNENQESVSIVLRKSESALQIDSISPDNEIIFTGLEIVSVNVEVETSGGVDGTATCYYSFNNRGEDAFEVTGGSTHTQILSQVTSGEHNLKVNCIDSAGNIAERTTAFSVEVKDVSPNVARVYADSGVLYLVTNEPAECSYKNSGCSFEVDEGESMDQLSEGLVHTTDFDTDKTYYIKCKDEYGNEKIGQCDIVVAGGLF